MNRPNSTVTLHQGVSLRRVGEVLSDAWAAGPHRWTNTPLQLREGRKPAPPAPAPDDAMELFRLLHKRSVNYLLVGGMALLTYVRGRNTHDVDLLMSPEALKQIPELEIEERTDFFVRGKFRSIQVDLLLTSNPLFKTVQQNFATNHRFAELDVPAVSAEGLIVLKLYALPSLYRQMDWDRVYVYEGDIKQLIIRRDPDMTALFALLKPHLLPEDMRELRKLIAEERTRIAQAKKRANL